MKNEVKIILDELRKMDQYSYVTWSQLNISQELADLMFDDGIVDGSDIASFLQARNEDIDYELDHLFEENESDRELIKSFKKERKENEEDIHYLTPDDHVLSFEFETFEFRYVATFMLIDYFESVLKEYKKVSA